MSVRMDDSIMLPLKVIQARGGNRVPPGRDLSSNVSLGAHGGGVIGGS